MHDVIDPGDKGKQGTHKCPNCGRTIIISRHSFGDPPKCPKCNTYYKPKQKRMTFYQR